MLPPGPESPTLPSTRPRKIKAASRKTTAASRKIKAALRKVQDRSLWPIPSPFRSRQAPSNPTGYQDPSRLAPSSWPDTNVSLTPLRFGSTLRLIQAANRSEFCYVAFILRSPGTCFGCTGGEQITHRFAAPATRARHPPGAPVWSGLRRWEKPLLPAQSSLGRKLRLLPAFPHPLAGAYFNLVKRVSGVWSNHLPAFRSHLLSPHWLAGFRHSLQGGWVAEAAELGFK